MAICGLTWETCYLTVCVSTELQPCFTNKQNKCIAYFSIMDPTKVLGHKTQSCITICVCVSDIFKAVLYANSLSIT